MEKNTQLMNCFKYLSSEASELYLSEEVPYEDGPPDPLQFHREWVCPNRPVIFANCIDHWPACKKWSLEYFREKYEQKKVTVAVTPNGYADAVHDGYFVMPEERTMLFSDFVDVMQQESKDGVFYIQKQNSNLTTDFPELLEDIESHIPWASTALGKQPDAVNFWLGEEKAVTSMHKDHYENLYCVISGAKHFILHPPTDLPFIPYGNYPAAVYHQTPGEPFKIIPDPDTGQVPWIPLDPLKPDYEKWPNYKHAKSIHCTIKPGEMLYLPSMWFHHVRQEQGTIAVNFWYDMEFDIKYNYFKMVEMILAEVGSGNR